jgi:hypothetical protein
MNAKRELVGRAWGLSFVAASAPSQHVPTGDSTAIKD